MNEEILGGLRLALSRGESLRQAMMSFYNAGYKKEEIEEAAKVAQNANIQPQVQKPSPKQVTEKAPTGKVKKSAQKVSSYGEPEPQQPIDLAIEQLQKLKTSPGQPSAQAPIISQKVSGYGKKPKPAGKLIISLLIFFLLFLVGALIAVFFFKDELINFFGGS